MQIGKLRRRATVQEKTYTRNSFGEEVITWATWASVWAEVRGLSGREWVEARQVAADVTTSIRVRYREGFAPTMRVVVGASTYEVAAPAMDVDGRGRELVLLCREVVDE